MSAIDKLPTTATSLVVKKNADIDVCRFLVTRVHDDLSVVGPELSRAIRVSNFNENAEGKPVKMARSFLEKSVKELSRNHPWAPLLYNKSYMEKATQYMNRALTEVNFERYGFVVKLSDLDKAQLTAIVRINDRSCFQSGGCRSHAPEQLVRSGAYALVVFNTMAQAEARDFRSAIGRWWVMPDENRLIVFNCYDFGGLKMDQSYRYLSDFLGELKQPYRSDYLVDLLRDPNRNVYINGDVYMYQFAED